MYSTFIWKLFVSHLNTLVLNAFHLTSKEYILFFYFLLLVALAIQQWTGLINWGNNIIFPNKGTWAFFFRVRRVFQLACLGINGLPLLSRFALCWSVKQRAYTLVVTQLKLLPPGLKCSPSVARLEPRMSFLRCCWVKFSLHLENFR